MKNGFEKQTIHAVCVDLTFEGNGVVKNGSDVIFVSGMFPGDEGQVEISYRRGGSLFGRVVKLDKSSKDRIEPRCKICTVCGGCQFQQYAYPAQLLYKQAKVKEQFRRIAHMDVDVLPTIGMDEPYFYRNKIQMPFSTDDKGNVYCGFYKEGSHVIVPVEECFIEDKRSEHILQTMRKLMKSMRVRPYIEDAHQGVIRHALIKTSFHEKEIMLVLVTAVDSFPGRGNFVHDLTQECPEITTIVQNINTRDTNVILGPLCRTLYGRGFINDSLCGVNFHISAQSFYQTNPIMTEILYNKAMEAAALQKSDVVFDAYSGIGTIGLIAAKYVDKVISVEIVPEAVHDAIKNAQINDIDNFQVFADDASSFITRMARDEKKIDVLFMDPPRKGSDEKFLDAVIKLAPSRIVYISCEPSTLARDVAYLSKSYKINSLQPVDLFPQTFHVETVASLKIR